jgi:glycosyltransferase involved in cell wall biosynthesis
MKKTAKISVILPCLNEEKTILKSIMWAKIGLLQIRKTFKLTGQVIVVDNGSTDRSVQIATHAGAHVIQEKKRGYGQAYLTGIRKSKSKYIIIGDSDATYDFRHLNQFISKLKNGTDLVLGNRFKLPTSKKSIPFLNRTLGNPLLTGLINLFYQGKIGDTQTGMRGFKRDAYNKLKMQSTGMEFASEMIIKAIAHHLVIDEVPIRYYKRISPSKLSPLSDAWRHVQAIIHYSPTYIIIAPGVLIVLAGISGIILLINGPFYFDNGKMIDIHTLTMSVLGTVLGTHIILIGVFMRIYTVQVLHIPGGFLTWWMQKNITANRLFLAGFILSAIGSFIILWVTGTWIQSGFRELSRERQLIVSSGLTIIGFQLIFSSFLIGILRQTISGGSAGKN